MDLLAAAAERSRTHGDLLNLVAGQPSTPAPVPVREAAKRALDGEVLGYTVALGIPELREAIGIRALHVPHTGVIDYVAVSDALAREVRAADGDVLLGREVERAVPTSRGVVLQTREDEVRAAAVVACAGLQSDRFDRVARIERESSVALARER
jgi:glycine/D-amino acid oxidase-like deaminating enzyme